MEYVGGRLTVASLYPLDCVPLLRPYGPHDPNQSARVAASCTLFELKACPKSNEKPRPLTLELRDCWQLESDPFTHKTSGRRELVPVVTVAKDIVTDHWARPVLGYTGAGGPAIWICKDRAPSSEEIEIALKSQTDYFLWLFSEGDRKAYEKKMSDITIHEIEAGKWLGKEVDWVQAKSSGIILRCPWCDTQLSPRAFICAGCKQVVRELPKEFHLLQAQMAQHQALPTAAVRQ